METRELVKVNVAKALMNQYDVKKRSRQLVIYYVVLLLLFLLYTYFSNMVTPLKLIPQTISAMGMGYLILLILSIRKFGYVAEFINWAKVKRTAEQIGDTDAEEAV